jgi:predicted transposase YdaD
VIEVPVPGQAQPDVFILEMATYPDARVPSQAVRDTALVYLERNIVPEVIVLFLREKGHVEAADSVSLHSRRGLTKWDLSWKAVKLWEVPAEELLAIGDVGLIPWVPLANSSDPPERIVSRCRAHIDHEAPRLQQAEHLNLLAVTQMLLSLRYNQDVPLLDRLRALLGGREVMIESPIYQEIVEEAERKGATEAKREMLLDFLVGRFGPTAQDLEVELKAVDYDRLRDLAQIAAKCRNLGAFRKRLLS